MDIGGYGSFSDGGIFKVSVLGKKLQNGTLGLPKPKFLPGTNVRVPHVLLGDEAFSLQPNFMRPFPGRQLSTMQRIFNYRLSRARRCVECAFGVMSSKWRIFRRIFSLKPENEDKIVKACVILHNFMITEESETVEKVYCPNGYMDYADQQSELREGMWRQEGISQHWNDISCSSARNYTNIAANTEQIVLLYFFN